MRREPLGSGAALADAAAGLLERVRGRRPRVHCITNSAAQVLTANLLLAAGAIPSLTIAPDEIEAFVGRADGLLVNLGTLDADRRASIPLAMAVAQARGAPVVLDPVFVEASPVRLAVARDCLARGPDIVRCNGAELAALSPGGDAMAFAGEARCVVAVTGAIDTISDGKRSLRIANGHPLMASVTAMGCAGAALIAAFAALEQDRLTAATAALAVLGVAGEIAGERAGGPGTFPALVLDALAALDAEDLRTRIHLA